MNQLRKAKSRNPRRHAVLPRKYIKVVVTYVLLFAIVFSNMSNPLLNVFAGQKKEEFRIHADELQRAAEEALEEGNIVEEPLDFYTKDSSLLKEYEELFAADGTLYEIFPDYEREYYLDDIELRIFLRISPDADPDSYALTGEETLIFLYTNGGEETVAGRVNIDGYISGICSLKSYMTAFEKKENSGSHNSGNSSSSGTKTEPGIDPSETETAEEVPGTDQEPNDDGEKNSQVDSETEEVKEPEASDTGKNDDEDKSHEDGSGAENSNTENNGSDNEENPDTEDENDASENTPDENQEENTSDNENSEDTGSDNENQGEEASDNGDSSEDAGDTADDTDNSSSSDTVASISIHSRIFLTDTMQEETEEKTEAPTEEETEKETEPETETETETEPEKETSAEATEPETDPVPEETTPKETTADETLPQETPEETTAAENKDNIGTTETGAAAKPETEETTAADDTKLSNLPGAVEETETEPGFERVGVLKGETYNLVALDQTITARAFTAKLSDMGFDKDELESQGHIINYMIDPVGSAELVKAPKLTRDGAEVTFGVIPQTGYKITEVTANGVELEETDPENIASPSNAERADEAVYYTIPEVLEDQEVEIFLEEIVPGTHPAFEYAENINGVIVTISAAEGILPEGTTAKVIEVTDHVENAVKEKVESEAAETDSVEVKSVLAYDITLYDAQGNVLNDSWSTNGYVHVSFSGSVIEEKSKEAETVEISHLDTEADTIENVVTVNEIKALEQVADPVAVPEEASVESVAFEAKHFSTYTVTFSNNGSTTSVRFEFKDTDNGDVGSGSYSLWNVFTDNKEYTTEEAVSAVLNSANQSSVMDEYIFKEAKTAQNGGATFTKIQVKTTTYGYYGTSRKLQVYTESGWQDVSSNSTLYFTFEKIYVVRFNGNGNTSGSAPTMITVANAGTEITLPGAGTLEKSGYSFVGWTENPTASTDEFEKGNVTIYPAGSSLVVSENRTLYAVWAENNPNVKVHFFIRLDARIINEPSGAPKSEYTGHDTSSGMYFNSSEKVLKEAKFVTDPTGEKVVDNLNKLPTNAAIATAVNKYPTSLNNNYGQRSITADDLAENGDFYVIWYVVKLPQQLDGYWHVDGVLLKKDKVTLAYDLNCTDYTADSKTPVGGSYEKNTTVDVSDNSGFKRPGYTFVGWNTDKNGKGTSYPGDGKGKITLIQNTVLYAQWVNASGGLNIKKVLNNASASDDITKVTFALYKSDDSWNKGDLVVADLHPNAAGNVLYQLQHDPNVSKYLLYETATADGYQLLTEPLKITVTFTMDNKIEYTVDGQSGTYSITNPFTVVNYAGVILPDTGGSGLDQIRRIGWSVVITSVLYAGLQLSLTLKRKREE